MHSEAVRQRDAESMPAHESSPLNETDENSHSAPLSRCLTVSLSSLELISLLKLRH